MKHTYIYPATKRSIVLAIREGEFTAIYAANMLRVRLETIEKWLLKY